MFELHQMESNYKFVLMAFLNFPALSSGTSRHGPLGRDGLTPSWPCPNFHWAPQKSHVMMMQPCKWDTCTAHHCTSS